MNSWKSIGASECAPPLMTFAIGTGSTFAFGPPRYLNSGWSERGGGGFGVGERDGENGVRAELGFRFRAVELEHGARPRSIGRTRPAPMSLGAITFVTFLTAFCTPLPRKRFLSPSRSSMASCSPVLAPQGTAARPDRAAAQRHVHFHGWITARVENFARQNFFDFRHINCGAMIGTVNAESRQAWPSATVLTKGEDEH